jgi:hypothetical protein
MWIVLIGADADTYGACGNTLLFILIYFYTSSPCPPLTITTAGPLIAAYHPHITENLTDGLVLKPVVESIFIRPKSKL